MAVIDSLGGTATTTVSVTVSGVLSVSVSPVTVDSGQAAALTATPSGGSGSYVEYDWYLGGTCVGTPLQSGASDAYTTSALSSTTEYCVVVTDSLGSNATTRVAVTVNAPLSVSVSPVSVDLGQSALLTAVPSQGSGSYVSYAWYSGAICTGTPLQAGSSSSYSTASLTSNRGYCVTLTDSLGGTATATVTVNINPALSVSVAPVSIDSGQTASLTASATGGSGSYASYAWYAGDTCDGSPLQSATSDSYTTAALTSETDYCVMLTDSLGGTAAATVTVSVNPSISVTVSPVTVDFGQAATLTAVADRRVGLVRSLHLVLGRGLQRNSSSVFVLPVLRHGRALDDLGLLRHGDRPRRWGRDNDRDCERRPRARGSCNLGLAVNYRLRPERDAFDRLVI